MASSKSEDKTILWLLSLPIVGMVLNAVFALILFLHGQSLYTKNYDQSKQEGAKVEHSICLTLDRLAALEPPSGNPNSNPSRAYDQELHSTLAQLGPDLEC